MKKILFLGGSAQQVVAIRKAKEHGYYTVLCDFLIDNPGQYEADKFYLISTTDKDAVLSVAEKEDVDAVLAYASDPAAPTAAYVAEALGLPTNPYKSVDLLCNKDKFRKFLRENGFNCPYCKMYEDKQLVIDEFSEFRLPVIVKPVDSSGSKGVTVLYASEGVVEAIEYAFTFSRSKRIIVEEFIEKKHEYLVGGDIFVENGEVVLWGLLNCHRDTNVNPLVPVGKSFPLLLGEKEISLIQSVLNKMIRILDMKFGSINIELVMDQNNEVWLLDIGPRAGGNMIPDLLGMIYGLDVVEMAILVAMGEKIHVKPKISNSYYATHNLHSSKSGVYDKIVFDSKIEEKIIDKKLYKKSGDIVQFFNNASDALGIIFLKFESREEMMSMLQNINNYYTVVLQ